MNAEKLKYANELQAKIKELKQSFENLQTAEKIQSNAIEFKIIDSNAYNFMQSKYIDFKLFKTITLAQMQESLTKLENEFLNL